MKSTSLAAAEARVAALISPELEARALAELEACLGATIYVRSSRGPDGINYALMPDRPVRLAAAVKILEFSRGKPATSLTVTVPSDSGRTANLLELAASTDPMLLARVTEDIIERARRAVPSASG